MEALLSVDKKVKGTSGSLRDMRVTRVECPPRYAGLSAGVNARRMVQASMRGNLSLSRFSWKQWRCNADQTLLHFLTATVRANRITLLVLRIGSGAVAFFGVNARV